MTSMALEATKTTTVRARLTQEKKSYLEHAASLRGVSLTDFLLDCAYEKAAETIEKHQILQLSQRDTIFFIEMLENPPAPNEALKEAAKLHAELVQ